MTKLIFSTILLFCIMYSIAASPLLLKSVKTIETDTQAELAVFDATRFRQIRVGIQMIAPESSSCYSGNPSVGKIDLETRQSIANIELSAARRELVRNDELLEKGVISKTMMDLSKDRLDRAKKEVEDITALIEQNKLRPVLKFPCPSLKFYGGSGTDISVFLGEIVANQIGGRFFVIDSPPTEIRFTAFGKGKYSIYIWGQ